MFTRQIRGTRDCDSFTLFKRFYLTCFSCRSRVIFQIEFSHTSWCASDLKFCILTWITWQYNIMKNKFQNSINYAIYIDVYSLRRCLQFAVYEGSFTNGCLRRGLLRFKLTHEALVNFENYRNCLQALATLYEAGSLALAGSLRAATVQGSLVWKIWERFS